MFTACLATSATGQTGSWSKSTSDSPSPVSAPSPTTTPGSSQTCRWCTLALKVFAPQVCFYIKLNPLFSAVTPRGRSASWARSGVSGKGRTQRSVLKEKATPRLSPPNPVSAQRKTSPGEHRPPQICTYRHAVPAVFCFQISTVAYSADNALPVCEVTTVLNGPTLRENAASLTFGTIRIRRPTTVIWEKPTSPALGLWIPLISHLKPGWNQNGGGNYLSIKTAYSRKQLVCRCTTNGASLPLKSQIYTGK